MAAVDREVKRQGKSFRKDTGRRQDADSVKVNMGCRFLKVFSTLFERCFHFFNTNFSMENLMFFHGRSGASVATVQDLTVLHCLHFFALEPNHSCQSASATNMFTHEHQRRQGLTITFACTLLVYSEPSVHCTRVIAMGSGQSPVGSRVQQTHNCAEQHPKYGVSPRVYRPAQRQSSRWLCGHPSTVACGSNHNRPFKQPSSLTAGSNEVLDFKKSRASSFLPSAFPQSWGHFQPPRAKLTVHEIQERLDAVR